jgi:peptidoglycan/LPS O-acetylase OafA/YrhL
VPTGYYPARFDLGHRPALDGLRGIAVLLVMIGHGPFPFIGGGPGVTVFFTLSGFLITALLLEERRATGRVDLPRFYARRALRLLPALAVCLVVMAVVLTFRDEARTGVWLAALYVANLAPALGERLPYLSHTWSLSLEEQFYVVWPVTLLLLTRTRRTWPVLAVTSAGVVICAGLRIFVDSRAVLAEPAPVRIAFFALWRADALLVGCLLALLLGLALRLPRPVIRIAGLLGVAVVLAASTQATSDLYFHTWFTLVPLATAGILLWLLVEPSRLSRFLTWAPLRYTGRISYGLYLWHFPIFQLLKPTLRGLPGVVELAVVAAASYAVAALSFRVVEQPFLRVKRRFAPGRSARSATVDGGHSVDERASVGRFA